MTYNKERHKQLVIRLLYLQSQGKTLFRENPEEDFELCRYNVGVEEEVYWTHRENFIIIMNNFVDNNLDFDEFEIAFSVLYEEVRKEVNKSKIDLEYIEKFEPSTRSYRFASLIGSIYRQFEEVEDEYCTEQDVKDYILKSEIF